MNRQQASVGLGTHLLDRRRFLGETRTGLSSIALASLLARSAAVADEPRLGTVGGEAPIRPRI
ncbi:MAG: hypothetical protein ACO3FE_11960, partial [Planctomycetaceae bacterium]